MTRPVLDGFDVSHWQGVFPWSYSRALGHRLGACKASQGARGVDPQLARNRGEMRRLGFRWRGLYHWVTSADPIAAQVDHFVRTVGALEPGEMIQLDCEESPSSGASRKLTSDEMAAAWVAFERVYPGRCVMYAGRFYSAWHAHPRLRGVPWWLPWYGPDSWAELLADAASKGGLPWTPTVWQWGGGAEGAQVPGVVAHEGRCDSNQIIRADVLDRICGLASDPTPPVQEDDDMPTYLSVSTPSRQVLVAIDGAGVTCMGYESPADKNGTDQALSAKPVQWSEQQLDAAIAQTMWRKPPTPVELHPVEIAAAKPAAYTLTATLEPKP